MQRFLAWSFVVFIACGGLGRSANAFPDHAGKQAATLRLQLDRLGSGTDVTAELKGHSEVNGELAASSEDRFELRAPEPITIRFADVRSVAEDTDALATPGAPQAPPPHRHHYVRNVVIVLAACFTFAMIAAIASK